MDDSQQYRIADIICNHVIQNLAARGTIPLQLNDTQIYAARKAVLECLQAASQNRDATFQVIQRETTMMAIQTIPKAIAEASFLVSDDDNGNEQMIPEQSSDGQQSIDDLVQQELDRRRQQDESIGIIQPSQSPEQPREQGMDTRGELLDGNERRTSHLDMPDMRVSGIIQTPQQVVHTPLSHLDNQPPIQPPIQPVKQPHSTNTLIQHTYNTIAISCQRNETDPIRIQHTIPEHQSIRSIEKLVIPSWILNDIPYIMCRIVNNSSQNGKSIHEAYLFPNTIIGEFSIFKAAENNIHSTQFNGDITVTLHYPDGEPVGTRLSEHDYTFDTDGSEGTIINVNTTYTTSQTRLFRLKYNGSYISQMGSTPKEGGIFTINGKASQPEAIVEDPGSSWAATLFIKVGDI